MISTWYHQLVIASAIGSLTNPRNRMNPWKDENGILYIGIEQFLLDEKAIDM